jgi:NADPH:quinone reductase-like Zn-dependent oxidoreductase
MKAVRFHRHGDVDVLVYEDVESPEIGSDEVLVRVKAASVNRIDVVVRYGYPGIRIPLPHIPGADFSGVVEDIGESVDNVSVGDRVIASPVYGCRGCRMCLAGMENMCSGWRMLGFHVDGTYAEYIKVRGDTLIKIPRGLGFEEAAALPLALLTSWHALVTLGGVGYGDTVLIWAGGSGIGTYSIQIAKCIGARVIATAGSDWKLDRLRKLGVDHVVNHYEDDVVNSVREFTSDGVDIVIEHIGGGTFNRSLESVKPGGKVIVFGSLTGDTATLPIRMLYLRHAKVIGMHTGARWELIDALRMVEDGCIKPVLDKVFRLEEAREAHERLEKSLHFGKIVLRVE